ncbi:MAG: c-type cytochrome [Chitinophagaceae bacterium]|nr:c-type cytochrome [Chitinophagaceae bacterium]
MLRCIWHICYTLAFIVCLGSCERTPPAIVVEEDPSPPKSPEEEFNSFILEPGMKIQLVASEPLVQDPVVITFDPDGRLWVVEMRGFMPDIDGAGEKEPVGRISVLEDTDGDGKMDASTIYLDSLIMPRALALVPGGALVAENEALWLTQDTNHDFKADTKVLIDPDYAGSAMPEHSGNGLLRGMDNWYYNVKSRFRYRLADGKWQRDSTEFRGQWGLSHDDEGRLYYNYNWSQLHADLVPPNYLGRNKNHTPTSGIDHGLTIDRRVYPVRSNPAVNRGYIPGTLDDAGRLIEFTAACSPFYYRATTLPNEYYGNVFVCEPSGNLVKRNVVREKGFILAAYDPHPGTEFLASTDERFRPVYITSGPDGGLYIADMYRGLVQHGAYVTPYLREQTLSRKLVAPVNYGRIWRVVPENWKPSPTVRLSDASSLELISQLSSPNGWNRDIAQRLLVERNDKGIAVQLTELVTTGSDPLPRVHALWVMEGLKVLDPLLLIRLLSDQNPIIRTAALRLLEPFARTDKKIRTKLATHILAAAPSTSAKETLQIALTSAVLDANAALPVLSGILEHYDSSALMRDAVLSSLQGKEFQLLKQMMYLQDPGNQTADKEIFLEMLTTSVVRKGNTKEITSLLKILDHQDLLDWRTNPVLTGISIQASNPKLKPIRLTSPPGILTRSDLNIDPSRRQALSSMFEWPGHVVTPAMRNHQPSLNEAEQKQFSLGRQHYLTTCAGCHGTDGAGLKRYAPPLIGSEWVLGDEKRLALIILQGMEGRLEVDGKVYDAPDILPVMPSHSPMDDGAITAIMTYIRNEWGNNAGPVSRRTVGTTRHTSQGRVIPWTADELNKHMSEQKKEEETQ